MHTVKRRQRGDFDALPAGGDCARPDRHPARREIQRSTHPSSSRADSTPAKFDFGNYLIWFLRLMVILFMVYPITGFTILIHETDA